MKIGIFPRFGKYSSQTSRNTKQELVVQTKIEATKADQDICSDREERLSEHNTNYLENSRYFAWVDEI